MNRTGMALLAVWLALAPISTSADDTSPHHMTKPDGELNMDACGACHNEDLSLQRSKLETCTLCHGETPHAGAAEHLRAAPAAVKNALGDTTQNAGALPLADDGHIYCGTCHLFHDPKVAGEAWLRDTWLPSNTGLPAAVRLAVVERWAALAASSEDKGAVGKFSMKATPQMRLPVNQGQLCQRCHSAPR